MVALAQIDRLQDGKGHPVLDVASSIARRKLDILDDSIMRIVRIDLSGDRTVELLIGPRATERRGTEGRTGGVADTRDFRPGGRRQGQQGHPRYDQRATRVVSPKANSPTDIRT